MIENIYIDTSIFIENNFLESKKINEIFKLAEEGEIQIILPAITYAEIINQAKKKTKEAIAKFATYRNETRFLRNINSLKERFTPLEEDKCLDEFLENLEKTLKKSNCIILEYPTVNIENTFQKYFNEEFPFNKREKKKEFPDAFALLSVELWCKKNHKKCHVFSKDKDLLNYKNHSLIITSNYEVYLDKKIRQIEKKKKQDQRLELVDDLFLRRKNALEEEIIYWLESELQDFDKSDLRFGYDIQDIELIKCEVRLINYQIVSINDFEIIIDSKAEVHCDISLEVNDESYGYHDGEFTRTETIEKKQIIPVQLKIDIPEAGDNFMEIRIDEINNGRQFH